MPSGKATTRTSHGAWRRTWSTVGEKNRDCRRQRGDEPSTIRSAPLERASSTMACPIERATTVRVTISTPFSSPSARASASDSSARSSHVRRQRALEREGARHAHDEDGLHGRLTLLRERDRRRDHLLADVPELHRHEHLPVGGARRQRRDGIDVVENASPRGAVGRRSRRRARARARPGPAYRAPGWVTRASTQTAKVSGAPINAGKREQHASDSQLGPRPERPLEIGLGLTQADHGELRSREREEHAEGVQAREERRVVPRQARPWRSRSRLRRLPTARSASRETSERRSRRPNSRGSMPCSAIERPRRVQPGDRRRRRREQDQRAGETDDDAQNVDERSGQMPVERGHDPHDRRLQPVVGEPARSVLRRETR